MKLADLEDCSHRYNLHFDGFQEEANETCEESESIITNFVKEKLAIEEDILTERAHHMGRYKEMMGQETERELSL